jgi:hypothetical protein
LYAAHNPCPFDGIFLVTSHTVIVELGRALACGHERIGAAPVSDRVFRYVAYVTRLADQVADLCEKER